LLTYSGVRIFNLTPRAVYMLRAPRHLNPASNLTCSYCKWTDLFYLILVTSIGLNLLLARAVEVLTLRNGRI